ncbi:PRC-barrel domain-containing protein AvaK [Calothrix sp. NIES-4071]|nr:PRC-barrel domain-containing protein AvaK [Calothrix sp. NIES-4071]BAZ62899.1 PRC-barrel domain-containing protein AvaK [Calothrix sp. NIES-4105]
MALYKISDFYADYQNTIQSKGIKGMSVYTQETDEKIGAVSDVLVDDEGQLCYLIVDIGDISFCIFAKKVLLPIGFGIIDLLADRVYVGITKQQAEDLPEYQQGTTLDYDYSEQAPSVYFRTLLEASAPPNASALLATAAIASSVALAERIAPTYDRDTYNYSQ